MSVSSHTTGAVAHREEPRGTVGRTVALLAAGAQIVAVFLPWDPQAAALDLTLRGFEVGLAQPTVGVVLVLLAALPAVAALVSDVGWPRLVSGLATGALVLLWITRGPEGVLTTGIAVALGAAVGHLLAAALATGPGVPGPAPRRPRPDRHGAPDDRPRRPTGHRQLDHTADTAFEAWGPTRAACFGEAVRAFVDSFADTTGVGATDRHGIDLGPAADDEDLLVDLLDEVIYLVDVRDAVPVGGRIRDREDGGLGGHLDLAPTDTVRPGGAVPKAITYHGLEVVGGADGWRCHVTVDV